MRHHRGMYSQGHPQVVTRAEPQNRGIQHGRAWQMSPPGCVSRNASEFAWIHYSYISLSVPTEQRSMVITLERFG